MDEYSTPWFKGFGEEQNLVNNTTFSRMVLMCPHIHTYALSAYPSYSVYHGVRKVLRGLDKIVLISERSSHKRLPEIAFELGLEVYK